MKKLISIFALAAALIGGAGAYGTSFTAYAEQSEPAIEVEEPHEHEFGEWVTVTPASCTDAGLKERYCTGCDEKESEKIPAFGHNYVTKTVAPTYFSKGYTLHTCSRCKDSYKDNYTDVLTLGKVTGLNSTVTDTSVTLKWNAVRDAKGYRVYRYDSVNKKWVKLSTQSGTVFIDSSLNVLTQYKYTVKAYVKSGSTVVWGNQADTYTAKTSLTLAKVLGLKYTAKDNSVTLSWKAVSYAKGYRVYRYDTVNKKWVKLITQKGTSFTDKTVNPNTQYKYTVKAYAKDGTTVIWGTRADTFKTKTAPAKAVLNSWSGNYAVALSWNAVSGAEGYRIYYRTNTTDRYTLLKETSDTSVTMSGLKADAYYYYCIKSYNTFNGQRSYSRLNTKTVIVKGGLADKKIISVKNILQNPQLPTGCEITSLTILLNHMGFGVDKLTMARTYLPKLSFYNYNGLYYGADFNTTFAGNPESNYSYGCYADCIVTAANSYLSAQKSSLKAYSNHGMEFDDLLINYINNDKPVLIWITSDGLIAPYYTDSWYTPAGKLVTWLANEHCVVLTGYDTVNNLVYVSDPLYGNISYYMPTLKLRYNQLGKQSVYIK